MTITHSKHMTDLKEKSKALSVTLSQIEKNFGKGSVIRLGSRDFR